MKPFRHRWWYHAPWKRSSPWSFALDVYREGGDEFCNPTIYIGLPLLGAWVIRYKRGPVRTEACGKCQKEMGPWCSGCLNCHHGPRCHQLTDCYELKEEHTAKQQSCPSCGGWYCPTCEPEPKRSCPYRGETL